MSRNEKIGISVVIGLVAACLCLCAGGFVLFSFAGGTLLEQALITDPDQVRLEAAQIVDYELPAGFRESAAMSILTAKMALFENDAESVILMMQMEIPEEVDSDEIREQFQRQIRQSMKIQGIDWKLAGQETVSLRGQDVNVSIYEGEDEAGRTMRQLMTDPFPGKSGMVLISIAGPSDSWPEDEVKLFFESIQ